MLKKILLFGIFLSCSLNCDASDKQVTLATLEWPPYIGKKLPKKGYVHEIISSVFERSGYDITIQFYPWARALHLAKSGAVDGLMPEYFDESRLNNFVFSSPIPGGPVGFYKRKKDKIVFTVNPKNEPEKALLGLKGLSFGIVRGYINTKAFDEADYLLKDPVVDDDLNLKKLFSKRIDLIFIDKYVARYLITEKYPWMWDSLEFMEPELETKNLYIAFSKKSAGYEQKLKDFNATLKTMEMTGELKDIILNHGF